MSEPVAPRSTAGGYERRDANVRLLVLVGLGIFAGLLLSGAGVAVLLRHYQRQPPASATPLERRVQIPPEPRLEADPRAAGERVQAEARERLEHYAWVDRAAGVARLPIARGMAVLAEQGWPSRAEAGAGEGAPRRQPAQGRAQP